MTYLLYHPRTRPGGRAMAEALGVEAGIGLRGRTPTTLIRWGSQRPVEYEPERVLNPSPALARASDKLRAFEAMDLAGVPVPFYGTDREGLPAGAVIGRTRRGYGGEGIVIYDTGLDVPDTHELYVQFIPGEREYRLHVVGSEVIRAQQKVPTDEAHPIRNHKNGYRFTGVVSRRLHSNRYEAAIAAVNALGLDFGAVDLLIGEDDQPYVLEVNTAPACSPLTARVYAEALQRHIGGTECNGSD